MDPKLLKFNKALEKKCQTPGCDYEGLMGHVNEAQVGVTRTQLFIIAIGMCCFVIPGIFILLVFLGTRRGYEVLWCPKCGKFSLIDNDLTGNQLLPIPEDFIYDSMMNRGDKKDFSKMILKARKKYKL